MTSTKYDPETKLWYGPQVSPMYNPDQNLGNLILNILHYRTNAIAQICADTGESATCMELKERTIAVAQFLQENKIKEGDFVGFVCENTENLLPAVFACFTIGATVCPLSSFCTAEEVFNTFSIIKPVLIFCDKKKLVHVEQAVAEMNRSVKIATVMEKISKYDCVTEIINKADYTRVNQFQVPKVNADTPIVCMCSLGSTGAQKRILKSHREMIYHYGTGRNLKKYSPTVFFNLSQLSWISGFNSCVYSVLSHSAIIYTAETAISVEQLTYALQKYRVTHVLTLPFTLSQMLESPSLKPFEYVEVWMISGFAATTSLCEKFAPYVPNGKLWITYGLTEKYIISCNMTDEYDHMGQLYDNVVVKLVDSNGRQVGPNEHGEILIRDDPKFSGYHLDPVQTESTVRDGWFHTNDIAYFDNNHRLRFVDRKVEIMNYEGFYIIPHEMESIINEVDGVVGSCIVGVLDKETFNYIIHAFVVADKNKNLSPDTVLQHVNSKVIEPRHIRGGVHFVDSLPIGRTGKVDKIKLRESIETV